MRSATVLLVFLSFFSSSLMATSVTLKQIQVAEEVRTINDGIDEQKDRILENVLNIGLIENYMNDDLSVKYYLSENRGTYTLLTLNGVIVASYAYLFKSLFKYNTLSALSLTISFTTLTNYAILFTNLPEIYYDFGLKRERILKGLMDMEVDEIIDLGKTYEEENLRLAKSIERKQKLIQHLEATL